MRAWVSRKDSRCAKNAETWVPLVDALTWKDVKKMFCSQWCKQWEPELPEKVAGIVVNDNVKEQLIPYKQLIDGAQVTMISKFNSNFSNSERRSMAKKNANISLVRCKDKHTGRKDKGTFRKHHAQVAFVQKLVQDRWNSGDPITKTEVKEEVMLREDCAEESEFYKQHLDPSEIKKTGPSWCNWLKAALRPVAFTVRKNSIGQTVPANWRAQATANAKEIREKMRKAEVDVVVNADQTFVHFYPENDKVLAPTGSRRVGGKIKADKRAGFTFMVSVEATTSKMLPPFVVYNGMKLKDAKHKERTSWWKYRSWRDLTNAFRSGRVVFHPKHWFDGDITIEYLKFLLEVVYPTSKVGLTMDAAPAHLGAVVEAYITEMVELGRLVLIVINGGLTSILQICDLAANKQIKALIKKFYYQWRREHINAAREKADAEGKSEAEVSRITLKIDVVDMTTIVERAVVEFNKEQLKSESTKRTFVSAGQHPYVPEETSATALAAHLESLEKNGAMYQTCIANQESAELQGELAADLLSFARGEQ